MEGISCCSNQRNLDIDPCDEHFYQCILKAIVVFKTNIDPCLHLYCFVYLSQIIHLLCFSYFLFSLFFLKNCFYLVSLSDFKFTNMIQPKWLILSFVTCQSQYQSWLCNLYFEGLYNFIRIDMLGQSIIPEGN